MPSLEPERDHIYACPDAMTYSVEETIGGWRHLYATRCNRWTCVGCGPLRTKVLCKKLATAKPNRFITLTVAAGKYESPEAAWHETRRQVPELIRKIRKEVGSIEYARVLEVHKSGYPHYHLLVRSPFIEQHLLSKWWCHLTAAFIVDIRKVNPDQKVAEYIGKYLTKQLKVPFTNRRVTWSKGFFPEKPERITELRCWMLPHVEHESLAEYIRRRNLQGHVLMLTQNHGVVLNSDDEVEGDLIWSYYGPPAEEHSEDSEPTLRPST